jgi:hypothetical protein
MGACVLSHRREGRKDHKKRSRIHHTLGYMRRTFGLLAQGAFGCLFGLEGLVRDLCGRAVGVGGHCGRHLAVASCFEPEG